MREIVNNKHESSQKDIMFLDNVVNFISHPFKRHNGYTLLEVESSKGLWCEAVVEEVESSNSWSRRRQSIMAHVCVCVRVL